MDDYLRDTVSIRKDVEGLSNTYRRNLYHNVRYSCDVVTTAEQIDCFLEIYHEAACCFGGTSDTVGVDSAAVTPLLPSLLRKLTRTSDLQPVSTLRNISKIRRFVDEAKTKKCILPCTPLAVVKIMEHVGVYDESIPVGDRLQGKLSLLVPVAFAGVFRSREHVG